MLRTWTAIAAVLMSPAACPQIPRTEAHRTMANDLVSVIETIADKLTDADASVHSLTQVLGEVDRAYTGSGYYLKPQDRRLETVWLGVSTGKPELPTDVEITPRPKFQPTVGDLDAAFGQHTLMPMNPDGKRMRIRYVLTQAKKPYTASIFATLSANDEETSTHITSVSIRRDAR